MFILYNEFSVVFRIAVLLFFREKKSTRDIGDGENKNKFRVIERSACDNGTKRFQGCPQTRHKRKTVEL